MNRRETRFARLRVQIRSLLFVLAGSRLHRLLTAARGRRSHGPGDLGPPPLAHFEALPSVAPRVARAGLAGHSVPRSTSSRRLTSSASRQARGGILNRRETRFARLPGFKSTRCSSSSLPLGQKSQGGGFEPEKGSLRSPFRAQIPPKRVALAVARVDKPGGDLNRRETRFARLPGFKSARCSSSSLPLGQKSQGRDLNPRTPDYKSGAWTAQAPLARPGFIRRPL